MEEFRHFQTVLEERKISRRWVDEALDEPEKVERHDDGPQHYIKKIAEYGGRWLRVVVNTEHRPQRLVPAFFDRRLRTDQ